MNKQRLEKLLDKALSSNSLMDKQQFHQLLYVESYHLVATTVKRYFPFLVDDICQEVYAYKVLELSLEKLSEKLPFLEGFLTILVKHYCLRRKEKERVFISLYAKGVLEHLEALSVLPVLELDAEQYYSQFLDQHLPPRQAKIIRLRVFEGYRFEVIQYRMNLSSAGTARKLFFEAKQKLKKVL